MTDLLTLLATLPSPKKALVAVEKTVDKLDEEWEHDRRARFSYAHGDAYDGPDDDYEFDIF